MKSFAPSITAQPLPFSFDGLAHCGINAAELERHYCAHHCNYAKQLENIVAKDSSLCNIVDAHDFNARKMKIVSSSASSSTAAASAASLSSAPTTDTTARPRVTGPQTPLTSAEALMLKAPRHSHAQLLASMIVNHDFYWKCWRGSDENNKKSANVSSFPSSANNEGASEGESVVASTPSSSSSAVTVGPETTSFSLRSKHPMLSFLLTQIEKDFGSITSLMRTFDRAALQLFGSGWVWLAWSRERQRLVVLSTRDSVNPLVVEAGLGCSADATTKDSQKNGPTTTTHSQAVSAANFIPILGCDMWEHAYLAHGSASAGASNAGLVATSLLNAADKDKLRYLRKFWSGCNWEFAANNFAEVALSGGRNCPIAGNVKEEQALAAQYSSAAAGPMQYNEKKRKSRL